MFDISLSFKYLTLWNKK